MPVARKMLLTSEIVARVPPFSGETGKLSGRSDLITNEELEAIRADLMTSAPAGGEIWIFAYGSLIWSPEFDHVEERLAMVRGWHRSFCLGWVRLYRGTPERPGIMLAMDRGGSCKGVVLRLPSETARENLLKLLRREMPIKRLGNPPVRWVTAYTDQGPVRAIAFPISRQSDAYLPGLTTETVVEALATAAGERGSMAEYLHNTVRQLEDRGIHDRYLWRLQELVAERILRGTAPPSA